MSASLGTRVTSEEKSVVLTDVDCLIVVDALRLEHGLGGIRETDRVRLLEVDQDDLLRLQLVGHVDRVGRALDVVARDDPEERRRRFAVRPLVSDVRVADGEMCAMPAANQRVARRRPRRRTSPARSPPTSWESAMNFCATTSASPRPSRPACRPPRAVPSARAVVVSVLTRVLRPRQLLLAEEAATTRQRGDDPDLQRPVAVDGLRRRRRPTSLHPRSMRAPQRRSSRAPSTTPPRPFIRVLLDGISRGETPSCRSMLRPSSRPQGVNCRSAGSDMSTSGVREPARRGPAVATVGRP